MKAFFIIFFVSMSFNLYANELNADLFTYNENKVQSELKRISELENYILSNNLLYTNEESIFHPLINQNNSLTPLSPYSINNICAPGKISSFWFTFGISAVGMYNFPYGAAAAPISVGIVYFSAKKNKKEVKKALWGCITGSLVGAGIKYAVVNML